MNQISLILFFFVFASSKLGFAQTTVSEFNHRKEPLNDYEIYKYVNKTYLSDEEYEIVKNSIHMKIANAGTYHMIKPTYYYMLCGIEQTRSNYDEAMKYALSMKYYSDLTESNHFSIVSVINMGLIYEQQGYYDLAVDHYFQAMELSKRDDNIHMTYAIQINLGSLKIDLGDLNEGIVILEKIAKKIIDNNLEYSKRFIPEIYSKLCRAYTLSKNYKRAKDYCHFIKKLIDQKKGHYLEIEISFLQNSANLEIHKGNYQKGQNLLVLSEKKIMDLGKYQDAIKVLTKAINTTKNEKLNYLNKKEVNLLLALSYSKLGDKEKTGKYYNKAILADTLNQKQKINILTKIASEEELIEIEQTLNKVKLENKSKRKIIQLLSIFFLIISCSGILLYTNLKRKNNLKFDTLIAQLSEQKPILVCNDVISGTLKNQKTYEEKFSKILKNLQALEKTNFFLKQDCNTFKTAKKLNTNVSYLSKAIKAKYNYDFSDYINKQRINYTIERLKEDPVFRSYSISAISQDVGYKSANTFVKHFKKHTQLLPSYYIKKLNS